MEYLLLKWIHILSATLLFGTGLGSAFYKWQADRSGNVSAIAQTNSMVVLADWLFTTPTVIIQPITGLWLAKIMGVPFEQPWLVTALVLFAFAGACWLVVVWLQLKMRDLACHAQQTQTRLTRSYYRLATLWFWLGVPAFLAMIVVYALMVFKPAMT